MCLLYSNDTAVLQGMNSWHPYPIIQKYTYIYMYESKKKKTKKCNINNGYEKEKEITLR